MIDVGQFRVRRGFTTGSQVNVEGNDCTLNEFNSGDSMNVAYMLYRRDGYVFSLDDYWPFDWRGAIFRYTTNGIHSGYAHLLKESDGSEIINPLKNVRDSSERNGSGPAFASDTKFSETGK